MNPYEVLGLRPDADPEAIRRAYLEAVRRAPPDRDPEAFRRVRAAYDVLGDETARAALTLFGMASLQSLEDLATAVERSYRRVGPGPWLQALKG